MAPGGGGGLKRPEAEAELVKELSPDAELRHEAECRIVKPNCPVTPIAKPNYPLTPNCEAELPPDAEL